MESSGVIEIAIKVILALAATGLLAIIYVIGKLIL